MISARQALNFILIAFIIIGLNSCKKYREYDNLDVIENTFSGDFDVADSTGDLDGDFTGTGNSGSYCFIWDNRSRSATINLDVTGTGEIRFEFEDARGNIVFDQTIDSSTTSELTDITDKGPKGNWFIKIFFTSFNGTGSFDLNSGQ